MGCSYQVIGFLALSSARGQDSITNGYLPRLERLATELGICFVYPVFNDGHILVEQSCDRNLQDKLNEKLKPTNFFSPALTPEVGADQFLDIYQLSTLIAPDKEVSLFPMMGGSKGEEKLPLIVEFLQSKDSSINPNFKIFGFSNATNFAVLSALGYCRTITTPFSYIVDVAGLEEQSQNLKKLLQGDERSLSSYECKILSDPKDVIPALNTKEVHHYSFNQAVLFRRADKSLELGGVIHDWTPSQKDWSFAVEGFIEECSKDKRAFVADHVSMLENFLADMESKETLPKFMEIGVFAPALGGESMDLEHDENNIIKNNEQNRQKLLSTKNAIKEHLIQIIATDEVGGKTKVTVPAEIINKLQSDGEYELTADDMGLLIENEQTQQRELKQRLIDVASQFNVPVVLNPRFGHFAGNDVVNSGRNIILVQDGAIKMEMLGSLNHENQTILDEAQPRSFVEYAQSGKFANLKSRDGFFEI